MDNPQPKSPKQKDRKKKIMLYLLKKIKMRHLAFLLVSVIGLALTTSVIIILFRISSPMMTESTPSEYIGIIGVLVAFVAAFIGLLVTIMFGNVVYTTYISKRAIDKLEKHDKTIPDLYVLILRAEAKEYENNHDLLNAITRRVGVIYFVLKARYSSSSGSIKYYMDELKSTVNKIDSTKISEFYYNSTKSITKAIEDFEYDSYELQIRIESLLQLEKAFLVKDEIEKIKKSIDNRIKEVKDKINLMDERQREIS